MNEKHADKQQKKDTVHAIGIKLKKLSRLVGLVTYAGFISIMAIIVVDVFLRFVFNSPILGSYEMVQYILMICVFCSFAYCQSLHGHIHVTMFIMKMPQKPKMLCSALTGLLSAITAAFVSYAAALQGILSKETGYSTSVLGIPIWPFLWVECFGMAIFAVALLYDVVLSSIAICDKELAAELVSEWE